MIFLWFGWVIQIPEILPKKHSDNHPDQKPQIVPPEQYDCGEHQTHNRIIRQFHRENPRPQTSTDPRRQIFFVNPQKYMLGCQSSDNYKDKLFLVRDILPSPTFFNLIHLPEPSYLLPTIFSIGS